MGRETKIGLTVLGLLIGVFGLVVYFKVFRTAPGPSAEAVASALEQAEAAAANSAEMLAGGPKVQLSPGAAEQAPVEFADSQVAAESDEMPADEPAVAQQGESAEWSAPPAGSRYADPVEADESEPSAPVQEFAGDEPPLGNEPAADVYANEPSTSLEEPATIAAQPDAVTDPQVAAQPEDDWSREPSAIEPAQIEPAEAATVRGVVPQDAVAPQEMVEAEPAADPRLGEPVQFAPSSVTSVPGETIQAGAEEVVAEPPATVEEPVSSRGGRYGRAAAPAYAAQEAVAPVEQTVEAPPPRSSRQAAPPPSNFNERAAAPATLPAENNFARPDQNYTIEPNDNYWRISQKLYGTGAYFKALFEHNRQKFPRADRLRQGDVISAPPIDVLEKTYPDLCPRPQQRPAEPKTMRAVSNRRPPSSGKVYIVEEGDTLFDIAKYELGQASRWGELYELNRDVLGDQGDRLKPGMELRLPSTTQRESVAAEPRNPVR